MRFSKRNKRQSVKTYLWSDDMLLEAAQHILSTVKINRKFDIPYLAGYNKDSTIIYIDKDVPKMARFGDKKVEVDKYLVIHEVVENILEDNLKLDYFYAHQIALRIERSVVEADGISWDEYNEFMDQWIKDVEHQDIQRVPEDLDLEPYQDSKDYKLIDHMKQHMVTEVYQPLNLMRTLL